MGKKKKFHNLYGQLLERPRLRSAFQRVKANGGAPGSDGITIEAFEADLEDQITQLISELRQKVYHPQPIRRVEIPKRNGGKRPLGIPSVRDRVVQENLRDILEKIFDKTFSEHSHGFRLNRSQFTALRDLWMQIQKGGVLIVDVDVEKCFDFKGKLYALVRKGQSPFVSGESQKLDTAKFTPHHHRKAGSIDRVCGRVGRVLQAGPATQVILQTGSMDLSETDRDDGGEMEDKALSEIFDKVFPKTPVWVSLFRMHKEYFEGPWVPGQLNLPLKCRWVRKGNVSL